VAFGEASDADTEVGKMFFNKAYEVGGVEESVRGLSPRLAFGGVSAKGEDVMDISIMVALEDLKDFVLRGANACKVGSDGYAGFVLDANDEVVGAFAGGTASSVGDTYGGRVQGHEVGDSVKEVVPAGLCFRGKKLKAIGGTLLG